MVPVSRDNGSDNTIAIKSIGILPRNARFILNQRCGVTYVVRTDRLSADVP